MKAIQITMEEALLRRMDREAQRFGTSRSAMIREALEHFLRDALRKRLDEACVEAYRRAPLRRGEVPPSSDFDWGLGDRW